MNKFNELVSKLREVFQIDRPELDFGIYRILNTRADEINEYLETRLKQKVEQALASGNAANVEQLKEDLKKAEEGAQALGVSPDAVPKVQELKQKIAAAIGGTAEHENAVFSHLLTFFSRYYDKGDFISQRRYKGDTYAIPYAGEEVMLHWANKDQYYIKSGENFSNYSFKLADGRLVHFRLIAADTAKDNRKDNDKDRLFVLAKHQVITQIDDDGDEYEDEILPIEEVTKTDANGTETKELIIRFEYKAMPKGNKQDKLVLEAVESVLVDAQVSARWLDLTKREPTEKNPKRTLLEKHLTNYSARNTADYFIHKNLGQFLSRELDFYIKNEVMHLDDVQNAEAFSDIEKNLRMIQCLRSIALDLITFLAQIEDFQKKLWTKKKFVVSSHYCITLDRVPEELYPEILANERQQQEWNRLGIQGSAPIDTISDLKSHPALMVDTSLFSIEFKAKLLQQTPDIDNNLNGLLIDSDNYAALKLINRKYQEKIKCIYIDPPYNTGGDGFAYKDKYQNSSWLTMIHNRLSIAHSLLSENGVIYSSIDENERAQLERVMDDIFDRKNRVEEIIWVQNTTKNKSPTFSTNHEYIEVYSKELSRVKENFHMFREPKPGLLEVMALVEELNHNYPEPSLIEERLRQLYKNHKKSITELKLKGADVNDEWKGIYNYNRAEYRTDDGKYIPSEEAFKNRAKIWVWREVDTSMPQVKEDSQKAEFKDEGNPAFRFYRPLHPITGIACPAPKRGWAWPMNPLDKQNSCFSALANDNRIAWGSDENKIPQRKSFLNEVSTNVSKSVINDYTDGEKELANLFGSNRVFGGPKPTTLISRFIQQSALSNEVFCDFFAGSGTSGEALIKLNYDDEIKRKYLLVEAGENLEKIIKPRLKKVVYAKNWKNGSPLSDNQGLSHCFKVIKLESYEDTLNNLTLKRQNIGLFDNTQISDDYTLNYMLDVETRGSLLSTDDFKKPFDYKMKIAVDSAGAFEEQNVDLVETFNYLIGLTVKHIDAQPERGFVTITGTLPSGETCLVLWRDCERIDYEGVSKLCDKLAINPADNEFDVVYINGDHNIPTVLTQTAEEGGASQVLKLRQIEPEFLELMFAGDDV